MAKADFDFITFDCYGTLIDWESGIVKAFQSEAALDGVTLDPAEIVAAYHIEEPVVEAGEFRAYREVLSETAMRVAARVGWKLHPGRSAFLAASLPEWQPFAETNSALERLGRRYRLGILSNVDDDLITETRRHFTVDLDLIVTAQQVRSYKPSPGHFKTALERLEGKRLLHAAQSYFHDVLPCSRSAIPVAWINRKGERADAGGPQPTYEVRNLSELANLLRA
jgi:2-haloacid dehalogenase/putative hydrolase of the HAD superfamily